MRLNRWSFSLMVFVLGLCLLAPAMTFAQEEKDKAAKQLEADINAAAASRQPPFDKTEAYFTARVVAVGYPQTGGVLVGNAIRDAMWKATAKELYFEYVPMSARVDVENLFKMLGSGKILGVVINTQAASALAPRLGLVDLPFLVNDQEKLQKFMQNKKLYSHYLAALAKIQVTGLDITCIGARGWATKTPLGKAADLGKARLGVADYPINKLTYRAWGVNPVLLPPGELAPALAKGNIGGLDTSLAAWSVRGPSSPLKNFTRVGFAQEVYVWLFNENWLRALPKDLQETFLQVLHEQCSLDRERTAQLETQGIKKAGLRRLSAQEMSRLRDQAAQVHQEYARKVGPAYLAEVHNYLGFKP